MFKAKQSWVTGPRENLRVNNSLKSIDKLSFGFRKTVDMHGRIAFPMQYFHTYTINAGLDTCVHKAHTRRYILYSRILHVSCALCAALNKCPCFMHLMWKVKFNNFNWICCRIWHSFREMILWILWICINLVHVRWMLDACVRQSLCSLFCSSIRRHFAATKVICITRYTLSFVLFADCVAYGYNVCDQYTHYAHTHTSTIIVCVRLSSFSCVRVLENDGLHFVIFSTENAWNEPRKAHKILCTIEPGLHGSVQVFALMYSQIHV